MQTHRRLVTEDGGRGGGGLYAHPCIHEHPRAPLPFFLSGEEAEGKRIVATLVAEAEAARAAASAIMMEEVQVGSSLEEGALGVVPSASPMTSGTDAEQPGTVSVTEALPGQAGRITGVVGGTAGSKDAAVRAFSTGVGSGKRVVLDYSTDDDGSGSDGGDSIASNFDSRNTSNISSIISISRVGVRSPEKTVLQPPAAVISEHQESVAASISLHPVNIDISPPSPSPGPAHAQQTRVHAAAAGGGGSRNSSSSNSSSSSSSSSSNSSNIGKVGGGGSGGGSGGSGGGGAPVIDCTDHDDALVVVANGKYAATGS